LKFKNNSYDKHELNQNYLIRYIKLKTAN